MINIGQIGLGYWGPNLLRNFNRLQDCKVNVCCDLDQDQLSKAKNQYPDLKVTENYMDLLGDPQIEAVVVTTPPATHYEVVKSVLLAGKHVFVEKPFVLEVEHGLELISIAQKEKKILMVGHLLKYHPAVTKVKGYIDSGEIGEILYIYSQRLNLGIVRKNENALWSFAPHDISMVLYFLGREPVEVLAVGESYISDGVEDVVFLTMVFPDKVMAHCHVSWLDPHRVRKITLVGSKKMVVFDDVDVSEKVRIYDKGVGYTGEYETYGEALTLREGDIIIPKLEMEEPLRAECRHFIECVKNNQTPLSDGLDGIRVVKILNAAQSSLKNGGKPVKLVSD